MQKFNKIFAITILAIVASFSVHAQVTIGAGEPPQKFSILELFNGNEAMGLRLPQITQQQRIDMEATAEFQAEKTGKAIGLMIFNTTSNRVECWNGTQWLVLPAGAINGLTKTGSDIGLGGALTKATTINNAGKSLTFLGTAADTLILATPKLQIKNGSEALGKVLTSDDFGVVRWASPGSTPAKIGTVPTVAQSVNVIDDASISGTQSIAYSGASIQLQPGDYQLNFSLWCAPAGSPAVSGTSNTGFASVFFSTSSTGNVPATYLAPIKSVIIPRLYNASSANPDYYGSGSIAIRLTATTTLYLWVYMSPENWTTTTNAQIRFRFDSGSYGPYCQLYAVPFSL